MITYGGIFNNYVLKQHSLDLIEFSKVSLLKFVLSEGEKIAIFYLTSKSSND
jgi:hypothetical protein